MIFETFYKLNDDDPLMRGSDLRERLLLVASLLWARGLPPPTADEFADAAMKLFDKVEFTLEHEGYMHMATGACRERWTTKWEDVGHE